MISEKLVETVFRKLWILLLPVVIVPVLVVVLTAKPAMYQSTGIVWVTAPLDGMSIGHNNQYLTPAQNQAQVLNDLLQTATFRGDVLRSAGLLPAAGTETPARAGTAGATISVWPTGTNLLTINVKSRSPRDAQAVANAVITRYRARATAELQRDTKVSRTYYDQQLVLAKRTLAERQAALASHVLDHPGALDRDNPDSVDINYQTLVSQLESQSALVADLQATLQSIALREASAPESQEAAFDVQDAPRLPGAPLAQSRTSKIGLPLAGLFGGIVIACTYAYVVFRTDHTIVSVEDLRDVPVPILGQVPQLHGMPGWARCTPVGWLYALRHRDFVRDTARSIGGPIPESQAKGAP